MKALKAIAGALSCVLLLAGMNACGKEDETLEFTETEVVTEAETTEETTEEETEEVTEESTEETEETAEASEEEILMTDTTLSTEILPEETEGSNDAVTPLPNDPQPVSPVPVATAPPEPTQAPAPVGDDVTFRFNDVTLRVGDNASDFVSRVPANSSETAPSCYGNGEDINYYYDDFTIYVWNENGSYQTVGIDITGPGVATQKGISIGSTSGDVTAAYGTGYSEEGMDYVYTYGDCNIRFTIVDGQVHYISYNKDI